VRKALVYTRDEHGIDPEDVDGEAVGITGRLRAAGYETYIVGGAVRDLILGKKPKDFDIVSGASPARIKKIFRNARIIGRRFRLVHVCFGPRIYEVSTFRSLRDGPTSNTFGAVEEDVRRRDFTLNALLYDPGAQVVVDYVGGMKDIRARRIRPIIPLGTIFTDDPVRMIRAVKYGAATGFSLPLRLKWRIRAQSPLLASVSPSRLTEEMLKIVRSPDAGRIVEALEAMGLYGYLQPAASRLMKASPAFRSRYLRSMGALHRPPFAGLPGEAMAALIQDYLEESTDWEGGIAEGYRNTFPEARDFVRPMNPPRAELDSAVRFVFAGHGITIKKSRFAERGPGGPRAAGEGPPGPRGPGRGSGGVPQAAGDGGSRRRRGGRRRRPAGPGPGSPEGTGG
jgi:poly(A) polymerase